MVTSLCRDLGVGVDHVAILDFRGLIDLVDSTEGVLVSTREPLRDTKAGLSLPRAGEHRLGGAQALAWVRSRQPEVLRGGRWTPLAGADRTRTSHAVEVLEQAAAGLDSPGGRAPGPVGARAAAAPGRRAGGQGGGVPGPRPARGGGGGAGPHGTGADHLHRGAGGLRDRGDPRGAGAFPDPFLHRRALDVDARDRPFGRFLPEPGQIGMIGSTRSLVFALEGTPLTNR